MANFFTVLGQLESGNNPNAGGTGSIAGQFQQSYGFQQQYGGNTSGVTNTDPAYQQQVLNNYANQVLQNNPNISVGDFYANYVLGTGNPAAPYTFSDLQNTTVPGAQGAANNFLNNSGISPNTPLTSLEGLTGGQTPVPTINAAGGDTLTIDPNASGIAGTPDSSSAIPGLSTGIGGVTFAGSDFGTPLNTDFSGGTIGPGGVDLGGYSSAEGLFGPSSIATGGSLLAGTGAIPGTGAGTGLGGIFSAVSDIMTRFGIVVVAIVIIGIGLYAATKGEFGGQAQRLAKGVT